jgi:hypothetical protein
VRAARTDNRIVNVRVGGRSAEVVRGEVFLEWRARKRREIVPFTTSQNFPWHNSAICIRDTLQRVPLLDSITLAPHPSRTEKFPDAGSQPAASATDGE